MPHPLPPCTRTPCGALYPGEEGETLPEFIARSVASFAAAMGPNYDAPGRGNADVQRQWAVGGSTS